MFPPKFISVFVKDLRLFFRRTTSTLLILLSPVFIVVFLGFLFGGYGSTPGGLPAVVCNSDDGAFAGAYASALEEHGFFRITDLSFLGSDCDAVANASVRRGEFAAALFYPPDFTERILSGQSSTLSVSIDNSKVGVREIAEAYVRAANQQVSVNLSSAFITRVWEQLNESDSKVLELSAALPTSIQGMEKVKAQLSEATVQVEAIDVSGAETARDSLRQAIAGMRASLSLASKTVGNTSESIARALNDSATAGEALNDTRDGMNSAISSMEDARNSSCPGPSCEQVTQALVSLNESRAAGEAAWQNYSAAASEMESSNRSTANLSALVSSLQAQADEADARLSALDAAMPNVTAVRERVLSGFGEANLRVDSILFQLRDLQAYLNRTHEQIIFLTSRNPEDIVVPIRLSWSYTFDRTIYKELDFHIYGIIAIILVMTSLLLPAINLIRERAGGVFLRNLITPTNPFWIILGKHLAALLLAAIEFLLVWFVASRISGIQLSGGLAAPLAGFMLMCSGFISVGLMIGALTKSENSAILAILTLVIPLIFVSGLIVPFEFMPAGIQDATAWLPSTLAISESRLSSLYGIEPTFGAAILNTADYALVFLAAEAVMLFAASIVVVSTKARN